MSNSNLHSAIKKTESFITSLENDFINSRQSGPETYKLGLNTIIFSNPEGTLLLDENDSKDYREILKLLFISVKDEMISQRAIESLLQIAILYSLDLRGKRKELSFDERLKKALENLRNSIIADPINFKVYYPVKDMAKEGLPIQVGKVKFCIFDEEQLKLLNILLIDKNEEGKAKQINNPFLDYVNQGEIIGKPIAIVLVKAVEQEAAKLLAQKELTITLDIVNFFSDLIPYHEGMINIPGESDNAVIDIFVKSDEDIPKISYEKKLVGRIMPFYFNKLIEEENKIKLGFGKVRKLLSKDRNELEEKIISAMQWAGKATSEKRKENAFLLYAISLESLILKNNEKDELTYRLSVRVAHLIAKKDQDSREKLSKNVQYLYGIRSRIVHSGYYQVTDADLSLIRVLF